MAPDVVAYVGSRVVLEGLQEHNTLRVAVDCVYMHIGEGMYCFTDLADSKSCVCTQLEVPDTCRVHTVFE